MKQTLLVALFTLLMGCDHTGHLPGMKGLLPHSASVNQGPNTDTAVVEKVFAAEDDGFSFISYQVTWHGHQVTVQDPIHTTNYKVGEKIYFLVMKHDMTSKTEPNAPKTLGFHALPYSMSGTNKGV